jgi:hypothetical protein
MTIDFVRFRPSRRFDRALITSGPPDERTFSAVVRMPLVDNYTPQRPINVVGITPLAESSEIVAHLEGARVAPDARRVETADSLAALLSTDTKNNLRITALDVGQAACVAFSDGSQPLGYFDVGAPMFFNRRSFPKQLDHRPASEGFVILSHWDFDHFALALQYPELKNLKWCAPDQPVGPNTALLPKISPHKSDIYSERL